MPYLKQIAAHTNCQNIQRYLEKGDRALAKDFFNLSIDERDGYGDAGKEELRWADEMDETRHRFRNDLPFGGLRARTYKHFIISPDPEDGIDLASLRELACAWALEHFSDYQVVIVYHDDNESRIPHAHIVVNNTNLETGRRMHHNDPKEFNRRLQEMAKERELLFLSNEREPTEGLDRLANMGRTARARPKTMQQIHLGRVERELIEAGGYSWVADIRNRVSVAKALARNEAEFHQVLGLLDVTASGNSRSAKRDDWVFSLASSPSRKVSGERLGLLFAKETIKRELARSKSYRPDAKSSKELLRNARSAVLVNDLADLNELAAALRACAYHNTSSIEECDRRIASMRKRIESCEGRNAAKLQRSIEELATAREYMSGRGLLPLHIERIPRRAKKSASDADRSRHPSEMREESAQRKQPPSQQHDGKERRNR